MGAPFSNNAVNSLILGESRVRRIPTALTDRKTARMMSQLTEPKACWGSMASMQATDTSLSSTVQFFATRTKEPICGGKILAIAWVYAAANLSGANSPVNPTGSSRTTISAWMELANGTQNTNYNNPNTGGSLFRLTFNGSNNGIILSGGLLVSDWVYPSDFSLSVFEFTDRKNFPWVRTAFSKGAAGDSMWGKQNTTFNYPSNSYFASCTNFAAAETLCGTAGIASVASASNTWSADDDTPPGPLGCICIMANGQEKAIMFGGTSILQGYSNGNGINSALNPSPAMTSANLQFFSPPGEWGAVSTRSAPFLNLAVSASLLSYLWNDSLSTWATGSSITQQRAIWLNLTKYFGAVVMNDPNNDADSGFDVSIDTWSALHRAANPLAKLYGIKVPNGGPDYLGSSTSFSSSLNTRYGYIDTALTAGKLDGIIDLWYGGVKEFPSTGTLFTGNVSTGATTSAVPVSSVAWTRGAYNQQFATIGGVKCLISTSTENTLNISAGLSVAPSNGATITIDGNTGQSDKTHPSRNGAQWMATNMATELTRLGYNVPGFTQTI